jgi:hypothetical protein
MPNASHLLTVATLATGLGFDRPLEAVRRAEAMLGHQTWAEVIRIENTGARSRYPQVVPALIFQLDSVLWFYTPTDGTQSLSLYRNHAEADKLNLGPLLAAIDGGFARWEVLSPAGDPSPAQAGIPNGCLIESMAIFFQMKANGVRLENPKLLTYYVALPGGIRGHTVLQYTLGGRVQIIDPYKPSRTLKIGAANENDPKGVADRIRGDIAKARHLPLGEFLDRAPGPGYATMPAQSTHGHEHDIAELSDLPGRNRS